MVEGKTERNDDDDDKKRSADAALAPRRISGKKHARTMSFSASTNTAGRNGPDVVGRRRALSQEPAPSVTQAAGDAGRENRARPAGSRAATATSRPKVSLRRKSSVKGHGASKQAGPKLPRSLPRRSSSGALAELGGEMVLPRVDAAAPVPSRSDEQDVHGETSNASSPPRPFVGGGTGAENAQTASPDSDRGEVVDAEPDGEPKRGDEDGDASSPDKPGNPNGEVTSDSDVEQSHVVYINKDVVEEQAMSVHEPQAAPEPCAKTNEDNAERTTAPPARGTAKGIAAPKNAEEEAPARESSGEFFFSGSGRLGRSPPSSGAPSCSSRDRSIERVLEADAALLRKKRAEKRAQKTPPGSAGSRVSAGTARSPKETPRGFKRFLSFGKKNRAREVTVVIDCTTSPSVSSAADDESGGGWQSAGSIKPRMGSSDATSDDTDHGHNTTASQRVACSLQTLVAASPAKSELAEIVPQVKSPKGHRSFFSFRSLNCGRG